MPSTSTILNRRRWWTVLEPQWKMAFQIAILNHQNSPSDEDLDMVFNAKVLRLAGPTAPYPNINFELTNLSGVQDLIHLEILVATHHKLTTLKEVENLKELKSLYLFNNQITDLQGVEELTKLEQLYVHCNKISTLLPLKSLTQLKEIYVNFNELTSFEGITKHHEKHLKMFFCLPNDKISFKDVMQFERKMGIKCVGLKG